MRSCKLKDRVFIINKEMKGRILLSLILISGLFAQSALVELSKREKERRRKIKKHSVVITNETLKQMGSFSPSLQVKGSGAETSSAPARTTSLEEEKYKDPNYWKTMKANILRQIRELEEKIKKLRSDINFLSTQFLLEERPFERSNVKSRLEEAKGLLNQALKQLQEKKKELERLYREARRRGVPPGWLR